MRSCLPSSGGSLSRCDDDGGDGGGDGDDGGDGDGADYAAAMSFVFVC